MWHILSSITYICFVVLISIAWCGAPRGLREHIAFALGAAAAALVPVSGHPSLPWHTGAFWPLAAAAAVIGGRGAWRCVCAAMSFVLVLYADSVAMSEGVPGARWSIETLVLMVRLDAADAVRAACLSALVAAVLIALRRACAGARECAPLVFAVSSLVAAMLPFSLSDVIEAGPQVSIAIDVASVEAIALALSAALLRRHD